MRHLSDLYGQLISCLSSLYIQNLEVGVLLPVKGGAKKQRGIRVMGQNRQFKPGQKAPNNGIYIEIGETGSTVNNPQRLKLRAGDVFPENSNHNRIWTYQRKP